MDDTLLFIPPCCVDKKLPKAILQAPSRVLNFYTHGDVTMEKFYRAVSFLVVDPHVMVLAMPNLKVGTMAFLCQCFERGWISHLVLSSCVDCGALLERYLPNYLNRVLFVQSEDVSDVNSHMVLYNDSKALMISGPMLDRPCGELTSYVMTFYPRYVSFTDENDWGHPLRNILFPDVLRHRQQALKKKNKLHSATLDHFLHMEFPPYAGVGDEEKNKDYYNFSNLSIR
jgi:hypothetical protein|uniref:hypothetical protein n=1 Tax=Prevotella sp. TaxID=59823 RepID=UPI0040297B34